MREFVRWENWKLRELELGQLELGNWSLTELGRQARQVGKRLVLLGGLFSVKGDFCREELRGLGGVVALCFMPRRMVGYGGVAKG